MGSKKVPSSMPALIDLGDDPVTIPKPTGNGVLPHPFFDEDHINDAFSRRRLSSAFDDSPSTASPAENFARPVFGDRWRATSQSLSFEGPTPFAGFCETDRRKSDGDLQNRRGNSSIPQIGKTSQSTDLLSELFLPSDPAGGAHQEFPAVIFQRDVQSSNDTVVFDSLFSSPTSYSSRQSRKDMHPLASPEASKQTDILFSNEASISDAHSSRPYTRNSGLLSSQDQGSWSPQDQVSWSSQDMLSQANPAATPQIDLLSGNDCGISDVFWSTPCAPLPSLHSPEDLSHFTGVSHQATSDCFDVSYESSYVSPQVGSNPFEDSFANLSISSEESPEFWSWTSIQPLREDTDGAASPNLCEGGNISAVYLEHSPAIGTQVGAESLGHWSPKMGNQLESRNGDLGLSPEYSSSSETSFRNNATVFLELNGSSLPMEGINMEPYASSHGETEGSRSPEPSNQSLASSKEFVGAGGGEGIFKVPVRGAVHMERPLSLELRPHPLKETQTNQTTRVMACTNTTVWATYSQGIMFWDIDNACGADCDGRDNNIGDEDAAAFSVLPVQGSILCLVPDISNNIVWSGHKDGTVRAWPMHASNGKERIQDVKNVLLIWQAHRTPVLAMAMTSYGELWTGSENGSIRAWPWEAIVRALSSVANESHAAASYMARSYLDLRSRGSAAGASTLSNIDVMFLLAEHSTGRIWSGGSYLLALWDARTRDILKVFGLSAQPEYSSPDISPVRENMWGDDARVNAVKVPKKEKNQGSLSFFQRSKNAVMGAADAVLRATVGGQSGDESKKLEALVAAADGTVWAGYANGMVICWDSHGNRSHEQQYSAVAVQSMCTFGTRIWVGHADGRVQVLNTETGKLLGSWRAHRSAVSQMQVGGEHVFTMAAHGGIRGWNLFSLSPLDAIMRSEMGSKELNYSRHCTLKIFAGTWNVSQEKASIESLKLWLANPTAEASIVVIGLQEMEMGAGVLAMAAAKETVGLEGSVNGQWWLESIGKVLDESGVFERVASRQLAGLLIGAWIKRKLIPYVGEVDVGAVACGFGRAFGNKGAVAVKMVVFRRTICVINCHFAAHLDAVVRRNADFDHVYRRMVFGRSFGGVGVAATAVAAGVSSAVQMFRGNTIRRMTSALDSADAYMEKESSPGLMDGAVESETFVPELSEADMLIWVGDFNYRINDVSYEGALNLISQKSWDVLLRKDQLRAEMKAGRVFQGMREGYIRFPPTYKFDKVVTGLGAYPPGYDSSEKKRVPAWCDRILFRDSFDGGKSMQEFSLSHPVLASVGWYGACMDVVDSDHKPVHCIFHVKLAVIDEAARRQDYGNLMCTNTKVQAYLKESNFVPETVINKSCVHLGDNNMPSLKITNKSGQNRAIFDIRCGGEPMDILCPCKNKDNDLSECRSLRGCYGFPHWLKVMPASGVLGPGQTVEILLEYAGGDGLGDDDLLVSKHSWTDSQKDKVVVLIVNMKGSPSSYSKEHRICVSYSPSQVGLQYGNPIDHSQSKFLNKSEFLPFDGIPFGTPDLLSWD